MADESDIPFPVRFNPFKHHRNYVLAILEDVSPEDIPDLLGRVCNNNIDIYTGRMTPEDIGLAIIYFLKSNQVVQTDAFTRWLGSSNGYRQITLEDHSEWIVRRSNESERYIHLHPARSGPLTTRFKGSTLKTVYLLKATLSDFRETPSLENVNLIRNQIGLSPIKRLERNKGILKCFDVFFGPDSPKA